MRTKSLLVAVALGAAGVATSMAQTVYSVNVVGYHTVTLAPGFNLVANQLNSANNTIGSLIPLLPGGCQLYKFTPGVGFATFTFDDADNVWTPHGNVTLNPGEGAYIRNNQSTNIVLTFVGEVLTGTTTNNLVPGFQIVSAKLPVQSAIGSLGIPAVAGDQAYKFTPGVGFTTATYDDADLVWTPNPVIGVGESFFVKKANTAPWTMSYTVQ